MRMAAPAGGELTVTRAHRAHLAQILPVCVEHDHAMIAIAVGDVDLAVSGIHGDVRRKAQ